MRLPRDLWRQRKGPAGSAVLHLSGLTPEAAAAAVGSVAGGLSSADVDQRRRRYGPNQLADRQALLPLGVLASQFRSPFVLILLAAALLSFLVGEGDQALIIVAIVLASSLLGFFQEYRAAHTVAVLRSRLKTLVRARRDGAVRDVAIGDIVPGDVIELKAGSMIAADGWLIDGLALHVDEAPLTGESFPAAKLAAVPGRPMDAAHLVHMGTSVRSGTGQMVVAVTGAATQYARIAASARGLEEETSFARGVRRFGLMMTQVMVVIVVLVLPINLLLDRPLLDSLLFSAALAVGLTPELLPAIVTVTLARGAAQLAKAGVLVKRLVAIENLGAMEVLCTDKTGTLTEGRLELKQVVDLGGTEADTARWAWLNAQFQSGLPNPLDEAILAGLAPATGFVRLGEVPYDFERKRLSVLVRGDGGTVLVCKGAVSEVLAQTSHVRDGAGRRELDAVGRQAEEQRLREWSGRGLRVIAVAIREMDGATGAGVADEVGLTLAGYLLFADPIKAGVGATIAALKERGVALKIITGDNRFVAGEVAAAVGLSHRSILTGADLDRLNRRRLAQRLTHTEVFAEVTPDQKERLIEAFRRAGKVVGYLGDGINDAPALRAADLGISVDTAVDAAREAADVVLLERDLGVLLAGVISGRASFANTMKYVAITTSANLGNMLSMAVASMLLPFLPLLAKQVLLNNFLSDLPLLMVSTDRVDADVLQRPGRWDFPALLRSMLSFGLVSSVFDGLTFVLLLALFGDNPAAVQTGWFLESLLTELAIIYVMRTRRPFYASAPGPWLATTSVAVAAVAIALPYLPLGPATGFVALPPAVVLLLVLIVLAYAGASELLKRWQAGQTRSRAISTTGRTSS